MPFAVVVMNPRDSPADTPDSGGRIVLDATISSVASTLRAEASPVTPQVSAPGSLIASVPSFAITGSAGLSAGEGISLLESNQSIGAVAIPAPPVLSSQIGVATFARAIGSGQTSIAFSVLGDGEVLLANISISTFGNIRSTFVTGLNQGVLPTPGSPAPSGVGTSVSLILAPLATEPQIGSAKIATNAVSSPGAAANSSNLSALVGMSNVALAPAVTNKVSASTTHLPAVDRTLSLAGSGLAEVLAYRDLSESGNQGTDATTEAAPSPQRCGLMTDFMPFDQSAVGQTIDQFLQRLDGLGAGLSWLHGPKDLVVELLSVAVVLAAWKVVTRFLGRSPDDELADVDDATSLDGISGLPGGSSTEES